MKIFTASGSVYEVDEARSLIRMIEGEPRGRIHREWVRYKDLRAVLGCSALIEFPDTRPLREDGAVPIVKTSKIVRIVREPIKWETE